MLRSILMMFGMNYLFRRMGRGGHGAYGSGSRLSRGMRFGPRW
jgi:hypothetical protein